MPKDQQKASVLNKLKEQTSPIALPTLLDGLELNYSTRAVRRWIDEWVKKGIVHKTGKKSGTRYLAINNNPMNFENQ
jgi:predicted HTH transcriptional regulator